ncbi:hypothetical protein Scep_020020 [Stephania cephalantha]|uniref:Uncharacterized protein n=1 Tax=Stephania cephalantha TaxID=152367 RepID=A0AAP0ICV8_9MAGN
MGVVNNGYKASKKTGLQFDSANQSLPTPRKSNSRSESMPKSLLSSRRRGVEANEGLNPIGSTNWAVWMRKGSDFMAEMVELVVGLGEARGGEGFDEGWRGSEGCRRGGREGKGGVGEWEWVMRERGKREFDERVKAKREGRGGRIGSVDGTDDGGKGWEENGECGGVMMASRGALEGYANKKKYKKDEEVENDTPKKRKRIKLDPYDVSNKRMDDGVSMDVVGAEAFDRVAKGGYYVFRNKSTFFAAANVSSSFPPADLPEIAFAVDLPGYGFAYEKDEVNDVWEELVSMNTATFSVFKVFISAWFK